MTVSLKENVQGYLNEIDYSKIELEHISRIVNLESITTKVSNTFHKIIESQNESDLPDITFSSYFESPGEILNDVTKIPLYIHIVSAIMCLMWSTVYHLFHVHSHAASKVLQRLDYAGISFLIGGSGVPPIYYSLYWSDGDFLRPLYLFITFSACSFVFFVAINPRFENPKYNSLLATLFVILGVSSAYPIVQFVFFRNFETMAPFPAIYWVLGGAIYIFGAFVYSIRFPEAIFPGKFDIFGQSHNLWHFFVLIAAITHYYGSLELYHLRRHFQCPV